MMPNYITRPKKQLVEMISPSKLTSTKGTIWFQDGFENTLRWTQYAGTVGTDNTATYVLDGANSLKVQSRVDVDFHGKAKIYLPLPKNVENSTIGIEFYIQLANVTDAQFTSFNVDCAVYTGTRIKIFGIQWLTAGDQWQYYTGAAYADITGLTSALEVGKWYRIKLKVNLYTKKYVSISISNVETDLSSLSLSDSANTTVQNLDCVIGSKGKDATQRAIWIDNFTLTYDE